MMHKSREKRNKEKTPLVMNRRSCFKNHTDRAVMDQMQDSLKLYSILYPLMVCNFRRKQLLCEQHRSRQEPLRGFFLCFHLLVRTWEFSIEMSTADGAQNTWGLTTDGSCLWSKPSCCTEALLTFPEQLLFSFCKCSHNTKFYSYCLNHNTSIPLVVLTAHVQILDTVLHAI